VTTRNLDSLTRRVNRDGDERVIVRPVIAMTLYSVDKLPAVMTAAAEVLTAYLAFVPRGAIASKYEEPPDRHSPDECIAFDANVERDVLEHLRAGPDPDDESHCFALFGTPDGQAGDYGFHFAGVNFEFLDEDDPEASMLRLELPWDLPTRMDVDDVTSFLAQVAPLFPFSSGNAGLSFSYAAAETGRAIEEIQKLLPRYIGFDSMYGAAYLKMRDKSPPAHWINLLDSHLVAALGGEKTLRPALAGCELLGVGKGLMIRAARVPPVVDVNWQGTDIGRLPDVARAILPVRLDAGMFTPMGNEERGLAWLARFDALTSGDWNND
jgi:hypothetical protein